jgi:D-3-phosphoglycerate dehydrogenase / 2-oxoglutarate reductase
MRPKILVTSRPMQHALPDYADRLSLAGFDLVKPEIGSRQHFRATELLESIDGVVGIIAGDDEYSAEFFERAAGLRAIVRWGIGMDSIDSDAARRHGVSIRNTPGVFGHEVADLALGYVLALARGIVTVDAAVRAGDWPSFQGVTLHGQRLGVVGFGAIGREIVRRAQGFGMDVVVSDPFVTTAPEGVGVVAVDELVATSAFVVLSCPLTPETHHLIDARTLALMREDAFLVNVARGPIVDESALVDALNAGKLSGVALDVFEYEPLDAASPLRAQPRIILGAHNASNTRQGAARASARAVEILLEELSVASPTR